MKLIFAIAVILSALPHGTTMLREKPLPTEVVHGYMIGTFNQFQAWPGAAPKVFDLVDDVVQPSTSQKLAHPTDAVYREIEKNDGGAVKLNVIRSRRESNEWLIVLSVERLP